MTPDDERHIERYLRAPNSLSSDQRRAVEACLANDPAAEAYLQFLQQFYRAYDALDDAPEQASSLVDAFVDDLFAPRNLVIELSPFQNTRSARPTVLSADTASEDSEQRFSVLSTLRADDSDLLVRVLGDHKRNDGRLYVLSPSSDLTTHVMVSFPDLNLDLVTGPDGRLVFDLPGEVNAPDWANASAVVRRPVAQDTLAPDGALTLRDPSGNTVECTRDGGTLCVQSHADESPSLSRMTVEPEGGTRHLLDLTTAQPVRLDLDASAPLTVRLYA